METSIKINHILHLGEQMLRKVSKKRPGLNVWHVTSGVGYVTETGLVFDTYKANWTPSLPQFYVRGVKKNNGTENIL